MWRRWTPASLPALLTGQPVMVVLVAIMFTMPSMPRLVEQAPLYGTLGGCVHLMPVLASIYAAALAPRVVPARYTTLIAVVAAVASVPMVHVVWQKYQTAASHDFGVTHLVRVLIPCVPVLVSWGLLLAVVCSRSRLFWAAIRVGVACVSVVRLAGVLWLRANELVASSPLGAPVLYPPGLPFSYAMGFNAFLLGYSAVFTTATRLWISSKLFGRPTINLHLAATMAATTSQTDHEEVAPASRSSSGDLVAVVSIA